MRLSLVFYFFFFGSTGGSGVVDRSILGSGFLIWVMGIWLGMGVIREIFKRIIFEWIW